MKIISFFSKFAMICNIAFLFFMLFSKMEASKTVGRNTDAVVAVPFFKNLIIILGIGAIIVNIVLCIVYAVFVIVGKQKLLPRWMVIANFIFLMFQVYYFFFRNTTLQ